MHTDGESVGTSRARKRLILTVGGLLTVVVLDGASSTAAVAVTGAFLGAV